MRFVRRASLVFSLVLIVAIAVGYVARRSELAGERDLRLTTAAEIGAARLTSIVDTLTVAAGSGVDTAATAEVIAEVHPRVGVCAVSADAVDCTGDGPQPSADVIEKHREGRQQSDEAVHVVPDITVYESVMTIDIDGPELSVIAQAPIDVVAARTDVVVWATTFLPAGTGIDGFAVSQGVRQTATTVTGAPGAFVVAAVDDQVKLPVDEQRFYMIIFSLAVVLLFLAGITIIVEQRSLHERASFDTLTRLPNRSEFERRAADALVAAERHETGVCLLLFDLNGFKQINDTYGHQAGDEILKVVGARLRKAVRDDDIVARWGGDEFVVVMPGIETEEMGSRRARQLAEQISGRTRLDGIDEPLRVKVSVGVALWSDRQVGLDGLVEAADQAMYQAKRDGLVCRVADPVVAKPVAGTLA